MTAGRHSKTNGTGQPHLEPRQLSSRAPSGLGGDEQLRRGGYEKAHNRRAPTTMPDEARSDRADGSQAKPLQQRELRLAERPAYVTAIDALGVGLSASGTREDLISPERARTDQRRLAAQAICEQLRILYSATVVRAGRIQAGENEK